MPAKYKILIVVGARPQIMKAAALANALQDFPQIEFEIVHSGQHYDEAMNGQFFEEFDLKHPAYNLNIGSARHNIFIAKFLLGFDPILEAENPDMVVVVGDTNTTVAAALASAKRNIPLSHVEAGLREWDKSIPEEINKWVTDAVTDLYFAPTNTGVKNLISEGVSKHVYMTGDITLDLLKDDRYVLAKEELIAKNEIEGDYIFMTCHRASNTDVLANLEQIVEGVNGIEMLIYWSLHPRTKAALVRNNLLESLGKHIHLLEPISYSETQSFIKHAQRVITDSGGVIKESYFHRTPGIIIDHQTEWIETVDEGWNIIAGPNSESILKAYSQNRIPEIHTNALGDGNAGFRIIREIFKYLETH